MGYLQQSTQSGRCGWYMAIAIFNLSNRDICGKIKRAWMDRDLPRTRQTCLFCMLNHLRPRNSPSERTLERLIQAATRSTRKHKCTRTLSRLFRVIAGTSRVLWRHGRSGGVTSIQQCEHSPCCFPLPPLTSSIGHRIISHGTWPWMARCDWLTCYWGMIIINIYNN
jgi:hypothetical protein